MRSGSSSMTRINPFSCVGRGFRGAFSFARELKQKNYTPSLHRNLFFVGVLSFRAKREISVLALNLLVFDSLLIVLESVIDVFLRGYMIF